MDINLQRIFFVSVLALVAVFALLFWLRGRFGKTAFIVGEALRYLCVQLFISLLFLFFYVLTVKNGLFVSLADLGVAAVPLSVLVHRWAWRCGALSWRYSVLFPVFYSGFLLWRFFAAKGAVMFFTYVIFNPPFAFIGGAQLPFGALGALLPLLCALCGRGLSKFKFC